MSKRSTIELPERFQWALSIIDPGPAEQLLEIGCGAGLLADLICNHLHSGSMFAVDSSPAMAAKAIKRNDGWIKAGRLQIQARSLAKAVLKQGYFHKIFAFNVNIFRKPGNTDIGSIASLLRPNGKLFVFYQTPSGIDRTLLNNISEQLQQNGFKISQTLVEERDPVRSFVVVATPATP